MRKFLLLIALIIAAAYLYHRFYGDGAAKHGTGEPNPGASADATPLVRQATPKPTPHSTALKTSHLGPATPASASPRRDPLAPPRH